MCGGKKKDNAVGPGGDDGPKEIKVTSVDSKTEPEDMLTVFPTALTAKIDDDTAEAILEFETSAAAIKAFEESQLPKLGPMTVQWMKGGASGPEGAGAGSSHGHGHDSAPGPEDDGEDPEKTSIKSKPKSPGKPGAKKPGHMKKRQSKTGSKAGLSHSSKGSGGKHKTKKPA